MNAQTVWQVATAALILIVGVAAGYAIAQRRNRRQTSAWRIELWRRNRKIEFLESNIQKKARDLAEERIQNWWPEPDIAEEAFQKAEQMADMRESRDAGRVHLPFETEGEPARIHQMGFRVVPRQTL